MVVFRVGHYRDGCGLFSDGSGLGRSLVGHHRDGCGLRQVWTV